ncbi:hypothetical protein [Litorivivens sp.]|uniref:hypothetical protein n=1 Tax=Litorivivens sp. TaxID=2020868 RepID=UPI003567FAF3
MMNTPVASKTLVFTVALNGYHWRYGELIRSQRRYAQRHGYQYVCVNRPRINALGLETAWLKLSLALNALEAGYDRVFYVDADARIRENTPSLDTLIKPGKYIYAAQGFSGRINSGVLLFTSAGPAKLMLSQILDNIDCTLPEADDVGWGENGHIIHFLTRWDGFQELPPLWNNNHSAELADYIRHYSAGPLRAEFPVPPSRQIPAVLFGKLANLLRRVKRLENNRRTIKQQLPRLTDCALSHFPLLTNPTNAK